MNAIGLEQTKKQRSQHNIKKLLNQTEGNSERSPKSIFHVSPRGNPIEMITQRLRISIKKQVVKTEPDKEEDEREVPVCKVIRIQSAYRVYRAKKALRQLQRKFIYRKCIINELIITERAYFEDLQAVYLHAYIPLKNDGIIEEAQVSRLFSNVDALLDLSKNLYHALVDVKFGPNSRIAEVFINMVPYFKIYFIYCNNYNTSIKTLKALKKESPKFLRFLQHQEKHFFKSDLENYLIKPVQRLPKYVLLMKDLLKNTDPEHCDYDSIGNALHQFQKVNFDNNKSMDSVITNSQIFELQKLYGAHVKILDSKRTFKGEEALKLLWKKEIKPVIVYFLNDLVLVTERQLNNK